MKKLEIILNNSAYFLEFDRDSFDAITNDQNNLIAYVKQLISNKLIEETCINSLHLIRNDELKRIEIPAANISAIEVDVENVTEDTLWNDSATKLLLDKYQLYLSKVGPMGQFKKKKKMWEQISVDLFDILGNSKTSMHGASPKIIQFEQDIEKINMIDDSVQPEILMGVRKCLQIKKTNEEELNSDNEQNSHTFESSTDNDKYSRKRKRDLGQILWDIQNKKEEEKNKRHQEKMALLREIDQNLLKNNASNSSKDEKVFSTTENHVAASLTSEDLRIL
ncbi:hypothetical protein MML48_9g00011490 [Holotrichia oblita]|uniref:Uncharacterized protein n=1 Tax=Holotrichia oblita TaxID=644536 RepID=A0ACB9SKD1_HOLOL|nr:hypothetical protein MML48_9g00011490 [Holotrichia oblita]